MRGYRLKQKNNNAFAVVVMTFGIMLCFIGLIFSIVHSKQVNEKTKPLSFDWGIDDPTDQDIYIYVHHSSPWIDGDATGAQYNFTIYNNSSNPIGEWTMEANIPEGCDIDSSWNGFWAIDGEKLIYEPADFNKQVVAGGQKTFGLVMYASEILSFNEISLEYKEKNRVTSYFAFWFFLILMIALAVAILIVHIVDIKLARYRKTHAAYKDLVSESLRTIANIIDTKDEYTKGHSVRVAIYSEMIAKKMGMSEYDQERIYYIGLLHDIGKVGIPVSILTKPGRLTDEEFEIIKKHPHLGAGIMKDFSSIPGVVNGIRYHHERYDGKGYNEGLKGEDIPIEGRIICVADSYDAMSSKRCYRNALSYDFILSELKRNAGIQFDPDILKYMVELIEEGRAPISDAEMEDYDI